MFVENDYIYIEGFPVKIKDKRFKYLIYLYKFVPFSTLSFNFIYLFNFVSLI